jgi:hypothetical protein
MTDTTTAGPETPAIDWTPIGPPNTSLPEREAGR